MRIRVSFPPNSSEGTCVLVGLFTSLQGENDYFVLKVCWLRKSVASKKKLDPLTFSVKS